MHFLHQRRPPPTTNNQPTDQPTNQPTRPTCPSTTLRLLSWPVAVRSNRPSAASSRDSAGGRPASSSAASEDTMSSGLRPAAPAASRGWMERIESTRRRVSCGVECGVRAWWRPRVAPAACSAHYGLHATMPRGARVDGLHGQALPNPHPTRAAVPQPLLITLQHDEDGVLLSSACCMLRPCLFLVTDVFTWLCMPIPKSHPARQLVTHLQLERDVCVGVHAKHLGRLRGRQAAHVVPHVLQAHAGRRAVVRTARREAARRRSVGRLEVGLIAGASVLRCGSGRETHCMHALLERHV